MEVPLYVQINTHNTYMTDIVQKKRTLRIYDRKEINLFIINEIKPESIEKTIMIYLS